MLDQLAAGDLHQRLLDHDPLAQSDLADVYLIELSRYLTHLHVTRFRHVRAEDCLDVASDLILQIGQQPEQYNPALSPLWTYLKMAARNDLTTLSNRLLKQQRLVASLNAMQAGEGGTVPVEFAAPPRNNLTEVVRELIGLPPEDSVDAVIAKLDALFSNDIEAPVWALMKQGVHATEAYVLVMGIEDLPLDQQRERANRIKDRIMTRARRWAKQRRTSYA